VRWVPGRCLEGWPAKPARSKCSVRCPARHGFTPTTPRRDTGSGAPARFRAPRGRPGTEFTPERGDRPAIGLLAGLRVPPRKLMAADPVRRPLSTRPPMPHHPDAEAPADVPPPDGPVGVPDPARRGACRRSPSPGRLTMHRTPLTTGGRPWAAAVATTGACGREAFGRRSRAAPRSRRAGHHS